MPSIRSHTLSLLSLATLVAPAAAQAKLVRVDGVLGTSVSYQLSGDPLQIYALFPSLTQGPTPLSIFDSGNPLVMSVGLDFFPSFMKIGLVPAVGFATATYPVPGDPSLHGTPLYAQFVTLPGSPFLIDEMSNPTGFKLGLSGQSTLTIGDQAEDPDGHTSTSLANGRVLVAGGTITIGGGVTTASSTLSLFDPQTQTFLAAGALQHGRTAHTATTLADGRVLMLGGADENDTVRNTGDIYDPTTGVTTPTAVMSTPRAQHSATRLNDGRVFVAGGVALFDVTNPIGTVGSALATTEIYNPATNTWSPGPNLPRPRLWHGASLLGNGQVLLTGGVELVTIIIVQVPQVSSDCRRYDPVANQILATPAISGARATHAQIALANGNAAVIAGAAGDLIAGTVTPLDTCRVYNWVTNAWTNVTSLSVVRARPQVVQHGGAVIVVGGVSTFMLSSLTGAPVDYLEASDETFGAWTNLGSQVYPRQLCTPSLIDGGQRILITGTAEPGSGASLPDFSAETFIVP